MARKRHNFAIRLRGSGDGNERCDDCAAVRHVRFGPRGAKWVTRWTRTCALTPKLSSGQRLGEKR